MSSIPKLLVLGGHSSGKTTYRTQLYQRVEHSGGELRLMKSVGDAASLQGDVDRLVRGLQPMHTPLDVYSSTTFTVADRKGRPFSLEFADYGGEQISRMGESNFIPAPWVTRVQESSNWLFFVRIDQIRSTKSFITDPVETERKEKTDEAGEHTDKCAELDAIETLQKLLFARGASLRHRLASPRLGILLSCWDELTKPEKDRSPESLLEARAPLFTRFVTSNWREDQLNIWGLSSTGRKLPESEPDVEFARQGAERMGYLVIGKDNPSLDLTIPISWLMEVA